MFCSEISDGAGIGSFSVSGALGGAVGDVPWSVSKTCVKEAEGGMDGESAGLGELARWVSWKLAELGTVAGDAIATTGTGGNGGCAAGVCVWASRA